MEYDVEGQTPADIRRSLNYQHSKSPLSAEAYDAYTAWHVTWDYKTSPVGHLCSIGRVRVYLVITTHLPRLVSTVGDATRERWGAYLSALRKHESRHAEIANETAARIYADLGSWPASQCAGINDAINARADELLRHGRAGEREMDAATQHGLREGAIFP